MTPGLGLVIGGVLFVAFLLFKLSPFALPRDEHSQQARKDLAEAKRRSRDRSKSEPERATALREAAVAALEGLGRPSLAASYARRAEKLDPQDADAVGLLALSLRQASRFRALERFLWRRLADDTPGAPGYERAYRELLSLYEGPLRRPEMAVALRRMRSSRAIAI
ncbi:MAG: hypothetical protein OXT09_04010 [Myxococcales bacterium]|nr:hypothetical protein [Myxococcales bacterium]